MNKSIFSCEELKKNIFQNKCFNQHFSWFVVMTQIYWKSSHILYRIKKSTRFSSIVSDTEAALHVSLFHSDGGWLVVDPENFECLNNGIVKLHCHASFWNDIRCSPCEVDWSFISRIRVSNWRSIIKFSANEKFHVAVTVSYLESSDNWKYSSCYK